jgi:hypothetical protein
MKRAILVLFLAAVATTGAAQAPVFPMGLAPLQAQLPNGSSVAPTKALLVDVNGDGDSDAIGVAFYQAALFVVPSVGGSFTAGTAVPTAPDPVSLVAADVDQDGDRDAIVLCYGPNYSAPQLQTFLNDGSGGFSSPPLVRPLSTLYYTLFAIRLNNDADPDLALWEGTGPIAFVAGAAGATYGPEIPLPAAMYTPTVFADDDGDGDDDIHFGASSGGGMNTMRNNGNGTFAAPVVSATMSSSMTSPRVDDVNGDGSLDAVMMGSPVVMGGFQTKVQVALGNGAGTFGPAGPVQTLANYGMTFGPLLHDLDGDGDRDLVAWDPYTTYPDDGVLVSYNGGSGNFGPATLLETPNGLGWAGVDAGDVDADGLTDLGVFVYGRIMVLRSQGAAGILAPKTVPLCGGGGFNSATIFEVADVNRDGKPDALCGVGFGALTSLCIVLDLDAPAPPQSLPIGNTVKDLAVGDWNRDGALDLAAASSAPLNGIGVWLNNGGGGFAPHGFVVLGAPLSSFAAGDVTGDGNIDFVVTDSFLTVLPGDGLGGFGAPTMTVCPGCSAGTDALHLADLNVDGKLDAIVSHPVSASVSAWLGAGNGSFTPVGTPGPMTTAKGAIVRDVNADGIPDFIGPSGGFNAYSCWLGNGNGTFTFSATTNILIPGNTAYGTDLAAADVTGDGILDILHPTGAVMPLNGSGGFLAPPSLHLVPYGAAIAPVDLNGDMQVDAAYLQGAKNRIGLFRNLKTSTGIGLAYGLGCPGTGGFVPALSAFGLPQPGGSVNVQLDQALGGASYAALLVSPTPSIIPVGFGCTLLCNPLGLSMMPIGISGPAIPGAGKMSLSVGLPAVIPTPIVVATQAIVLDAASPLSYSASNGLFFVIY